MAITPSPAQCIAAEIARFVFLSPHNRLAGIDGTPIFAEPLLGYADADDPLFASYKQLIGASHLTPREMVAAAGQAYALDRRLVVLSWILPIAEATRASNRAQTHEPSERWIHTRHHGERFNDVLRAHVVAWLQGQGYLAVAPVISEAFVIHWEGVTQAPRSTWSERHVAYAAGLGTFGLSRGLITARGIAMRCGSVITDLPATPSPRPYATPFDNCPYLTSGECGACIERCPAGAITSQGMDKMACYRYQRQTLAHLDARYPGWSKGCGLCQVGVPCEAGIPD